MTQIVPPFVASIFVFASIAHAAAFILDASESVEASATHARTHLAAQSATQSPLLRAHLDRCRECASVAERQASRTDAPAYNRSHPMNTGAGTSP